MPQFDVERMGHLNHVVENYDAGKNLYAEVFGATVFREWEEAHAGSLNALLLVSDTCFELFGVTDPHGAVGSWMGRQGQGWHSLEWTLPSFEQAVEVTTALGIRLTERVEGSYVFTHPRDCHGLCLELTAAHFPGDQRDEPGWAPTFWSDEHPLGITGIPCLRVSARDAEAAATWLATVTGSAVSYDQPRPGLAARAVGVELPGHCIEFVEPSGDGVMAAFVEARGERIHSISFPVRHLDGALAYLEGAGVGVIAGSSEEARYLDPASTCGGLIELAQA